MKIQCDVCNKAEASVFCSADDAALCDGCDHRVHHANKLASKHQRFSLINLSSKDAPRCDICQERRAFLFCREDRAILCRECDVSIHTANEHTKKHNRFLLTGVKLSSTSSIFTASSPLPATTKTTTTTTITSSSNGFDASVDSQTTNTTRHQPMMKKKPKSVVPVPVPFTPELDDLPPSFQINNSKQSKGFDYFNQTTTSPSAAGSTSSISEYLIEMLPGWQVEDLLDSSPNGFCKNDNLLPCLDTNFESNNIGGAQDDFTLWVPEIPTPRQPPPIAQNGMFDELKEVINPNSKTSRRRSHYQHQDVTVPHGVTVPQMSPPTNKRPRTLW